MSRYAALDLGQYPVADILAPIDFEDSLAAVVADFQRRWEIVAAAKGLPSFDAIMLESEPVRAIMEVFAYREMILRAHVNDRVRQLSLTSATGRALDHIGATYFRRTTRLEGEDDETFRARLAVAPEAWSTAGPEGAYVFWGYSASPDILDLAVYSVDEGVALPAIIRFAVLSKSGVAASAGMIATIRSAMSKIERIPAADHVVGQAATYLDYSISIELQIAPGVAHQPLIDGARARLTHWTTGKRRWAGENAEGPVWLIGRTIDAGDIKAIAWSGDPNILGVRVISPAVTINPAAPGYAAALAAYQATVTAIDAAPLPDALTAHLFRAPRCTSITITARTWNGDI